MYGYTITINGRVSKVDGDICYENIVCSNHMIKKFECDKLFAETDDYIVMLDGVVLNRRVLMDEYGLEENNMQWLSTIIMMYKEFGESFFSKLRGSFSGAFYEKAINKWIIFSDQIGSKFTYYAKVGNFFCCSEVMGNMYHMMQSNGVSYHLNAENAMLLLSYGYMLDNRTLCDEIHKIPPGCYITYQNGIIGEHLYYLLDNTSDYSIKEHDAIEIIDYYFRQAVVKEFEKDKEYGYQHLVALSGGLDCRMTSFVAHDLGYTKQLNMTFSQSEYLDQTLPMQMSSAMKHEWIFKALDNGLWLYDVDEVTHTSGGNVLYFGMAHANSLFKYLNFEHLGMHHSGQIGDVIVGSFITLSDRDKQYEFGQKAYSQKYIDRLKDVKLLLNLNKELGLLYYRAFNGTNNGEQIIYNYTETISPFCDLDLLEKALSIPLEFRQKHILYKKWILTKYPQAALFAWETTGRKINAPTLHIRNRSIPLANIPHSIIEHMNRIFGVKEQKNSLKSMNPVAYYLSHNDDLRKYLDDYFKYVDAIPDMELRTIIHDIQLNGTAMEKIQAVSLLSAIKLFFV